jgi:hypothetical protein
MPFPLLREQQRSPQTRHHINDDESDYVKRERKRWRCWRLRRRLRHAKPADFVSRGIDEAKHRALEKKARQKIPRSIVRLTTRRKQTFIADFVTTRRKRASCSFIWHSRHTVC